MNKALLILFLFLNGCEGYDSAYDRGYDDGYAVGYNETCNIRATMIYGDFDQEGYAEGYDDGYEDGVRDCRAGR